MSLEFSTAKMTFEGKQINAALIELENAVLCFAWEGLKPVLGTLTVTLPGRMSSPLLGDRDSFLGQVLGDQLASFFEKMALVSINLKTVTGEAVGRKILELTRQTFMKKDPQTDLVHGEGGE